MQRDGRADREGRRAASGRIDRDENVLHVDAVVAVVPHDFLRLVLLEGLDVFGRVELGAAVRRDAQRLAKQHGGVLAEDRANHLDLLARNPARHLGQLVRALLGVLRAKTVVAHQRDRDALEDLLPRLVAKLDQLGVVVAAVEQRADAQKHRRLHAQKRHDHLIDQALVAVRCFLQNHHFAGDALQRLSRTAHGRGSQSAEVVRAR